ILVSCVVKVGSRKREKTICSCTKQRTKDFPGEVFADGRKLFCKICNIVLNHHRKLIISSHLTKSQKYLKRKAALQGESQKNRILLASFNTTTIAQYEHWMLSMTESCAAENISLSKMDHPFICKLLNTQVKNGGASPRGYQLQDAYLTDTPKWPPQRLNSQLWV
uniref:Uncharacterized protein n=1 Tax=Gopherus evgoodei TaxID=1825980 RepID=A0A8C4VJN9_9SAUR